MKGLTKKQQQLQGSLLAAYRKSLERTSKDPYSQYEFNDLVEQGLYALGGGVWFEAAVKYYSYKTAIAFLFLRESIIDTLNNIIDASAEECKRIASEYKWTGDCYWNEEE